jgi:hypothetical protein
VTTQLLASPISRIDVQRALLTWKRRDFKYGDSDCCAFVAHMASELTGRDYKRFITYSSEKSAYDIIGLYGGFEPLMDSIFKTRRYPEQGDPCLVKVPIIGELMGIRYGDNIVCVTKKGLAEVSEKYLVTGWNLWRH